MDDAVIIGEDHDACASRRERNVIYRGNTHAFTIAIVNRER